MIKLVFLTDVSWQQLFYEIFIKVVAFIKRSNDTIQDFFVFIVVCVIGLFVLFGMVGIFYILKCRSIERAFKRISVFCKRLILMAVGGCTLVLLLVLAIMDNAEKQLVINEICSKNNSVIQNEGGEYYDYIEIYNPSVWNISLKDFCVTDNISVSDTLQLGEVNIPAKGYYIIWLDSGIFALSSKGESVYLLSSSGEIIDAVQIPALKSDMVYARQNDGADIWEVQLPSPMTKNDASRKPVEKPVFSAESGFYEEEFMLYIKAGAGETIYYTLDGSIPTTESAYYTDGIVVYNPSDSPNVYRSIQNVVKDWKEYIPNEEVVDKAFIIRAIAVDEYGNSSETVTKTYFVDMEKYQNSYVLSIVSEPDDLFGEEGIYVTGEEYDNWYLGNQEGDMPLCNFAKEGKEYEVEATLALFNDELLMDQEAGIRIQGAGSRYAENKRFSFFARKEYSESRHFDYNLFGIQMHSFYTRLEFVEALLNSIVIDRNVGTLKAIPAYVFVNGEYWYYSYLMEKYSEDFLANMYHVEKDTVYLEDWTPDEIYNFIAVYDLGEAENYKKFCEFVDVQSYIDWLACNIYLCNMDASEMKNIKVWKTTENTGNDYNDGKWRWLLYDMDCVTWINTDYYGGVAYEVDSFAQVKQFIGQAYNEETLYLALWSNEDFCEQFVLTFMDLANYTFSPEVVGEQLEVWGETLEWNGGFFKYRYEYIVPALAKEFFLQGSLEELTISVNETDAGRIRVNTIEPELSESGWTGKYYTDYQVVITAIPNEGYEFVGWLHENDDEAVLIQEEQLSIDLEEGENLWNACFQKVTD